LNLQYSINLPVLVRSAESTGDVPGVPARLHCSAANANLCGAAAEASSDQVVYRESSQRVRQPGSDHRSPDSLCGQWSGRAKIAGSWRCPGHPEPHHIYVNSAAAGQRMGSYQTANQQNGMDNSDVHLGAILRVPRVPLHLG